MDDVYASFRKELIAKGVYQRDYAYYGTYAALALVGVFLSFYFLTQTDNVLLQALNGGFLAFVLVQIGMLGHDLSHGQVFASRRANRISALIVWGLFGGLSASKWFLKHTAHHEHTNEVGRDPDLDIPFIFSDVQRAHIRPFSRVFVRYQHILFFLALPFLYLHQVRYAVLHTMSLRSRTGVVELVFITLHFIFLVAVPALVLPPAAVAAFFSTHILCVGLYMSLVFAPNHKGKRVLGFHEHGGWREQVILTRNITPAWYIFYIFGGLNFQIEHHLFPGAARTMYKELRMPVKEFCEKNGLAYDEVSWWATLRDMYRALRAESYAEKSVPR